MPAKILENPKAQSLTSCVAGKKIAMVIAFQDFQDEECFIPRSIFLEQGAMVKIVSDEKGEAVGVFGGAINVDLVFDELNVSDFDAIIFVGGGGAAKYIENDKCHCVARSAISENKILGAICIAPAILARAGVLKNKKATAWSSSMDKSIVKILKNEGAIYQDDAVVVDEKIITANGPQSARQFAQAIVGKFKQN
ncbi:DJ-1/PfpI family protein [Patescibacteria group bacterium]|nr:DJ-1/PfpI family protein [Patescibacteria group bacterium]